MVLKEKDLKIGTRQKKLIVLQIKSITLQIFLICAAVLSVSTVAHYVLTTKAFKMLRCCLI